jgi:hypothetical protein
LFEFVTNTTFASDMVSRQKPGTPGSIARFSQENTRLSDPRTAVAFGVNLDYVAAIHVFVHSLFCKGVR